MIGRAGACLGEILCFNLLYAFISGFLLHLRRYSVQITFEIFTSYIIRHYIFVFF